MARSRNPDLIFKECLTERVARVVQSYGQPDVHGPLDRVTLFVTHRCNLRCRYCNGPHRNPNLDALRRRMMLARDVDLPLYRRLLEDWAEHDLVHIHFTGGEATLNPGLPEFVRLATKHKILSSLTTNGTASREFYAELVRAGLTEIRVSLDSHDEARADAMVGVPGTWQRVTANLRAFAEMKRAGLELFVIINACVASCNVDEVDATIEGLSTYEPDDVKLLVVAEEGAAVQEHGKRELVETLLACARRSGSHYELLERKIRGLFRKDATGLEDPLSQHEMRHCFIPLTERTLDASGFYPCSIYLRYQGQPLASITSSFDEQQDAIDEFVDSHDCHEDPICRRNCTSCCKEFNLQANHVLRQRDADEAGRARGVIEIPEVEPEVIQSAVAEYAAIRSLPLRTGAVPHLIVKPYGMLFLDKIREYLTGQGIVIHSEVDITEWPRFSLMLYFRNARGDAAAWRIAKNAAFCQAEPEGNARLLILEDGVPEGKLLRIKRELRRLFGEPVSYFRYGGEVGRIRVNCLHSPDYADLEMEHRIIAYFLGIASDVTHQGTSAASQ